MPDYLIPSLLLQILAVGYTPGPANIFAFTTAVRFGNREALKVWAGLLTGFSVTACTMAVLTRFVGIILGEYVIWMKYVGGMYLLYLAWRALRMGMTASGRKGCTFWDGVAVQLTNAKTLLFEVTVYSTFVLPYSSHLADFLQVAAWLLLAGPAANLVWIFMGSTLKRFFERNMRTADIVTAAALAGCAVWIFLA